MSLNEFTNLADKKEWMNINCKSIICEDLEVTGDDVNSTYNAGLSDTSFYSLASATETPILSNAVSNVLGSLEPKSLVVGKSYKLTTIYDYVSPNAGNIATFYVNWGGERWDSIIVNTLPTVNAAQTMTIDFTFTVQSLTTGATLLYNFDLQYSDESDVWSRQSDTLKVSKAGFVVDNLGISLSVNPSLTGLDMTLVSAVLKTEYE